MTYRTADVTYAIKFRANHRACGLVVPYSNAAYVVRCATRGPGMLIDSCRGQLSARDERVQVRLTRWPPPASASAVIGGPGARRGEFPRVPTDREGVTERTNLSVGIVSLADRDPGPKTA
ncbi:hypothetical protein GCM10025331_06640 [Actinoplanes utahensis]|nr:hypothetical protein Aut01nite_13910 [Actinoplanes utahensis]